MLVSRPQLDCPDSQSLSIIKTSRWGFYQNCELRVHKNTFKIFCTDVFIFFQSLRLFPYFRVLSNFKTLALILFVLRELYRRFEDLLYWSSVSLWSIRVKREWNFPSIESSVFKTLFSVKTSFKRNVWKSYCNRFCYFFRSCMFAERKTSILLKKISLTCKYEWLVVTQAAQVHRKKRVLSTIKLVTCVKQSLAQVLRHLCHATPLGCLWLEDDKDGRAQTISQKITHSIIVGLTRFFCY